MALAQLKAGDPHVSAHNDERNVINTLQSLVYNGVNLVYNTATSSYPARTALPAGTIAIFVGPNNPGSAMVAGDIWVNTSPQSGGGSGSGSSQPTGNPQTGTTYTPVLADGDNTLVTLNNTNDIAVTLPPNSAVAFPIYTTIQFKQIGAGKVTVSGGAGVTANTMSSTGAGQEIWATKIATDTWSLVVLGATASSVVNNAQSPTVTPPGSARKNELYAPGLTGATTVAAPSGTLANGNQILIRMKDDGTSRALTWDPIYKPFGFSLPTQTPAGKHFYVFGTYNSVSGKVDLLGYAPEP